jgi:membrane protein DedA with SNARE-associated domain
LLTHLTDALTTLITNLYVSTGLLGIVLAMAIESCCIPLPSEIVMPLAGVMLAGGKLLHGTNSFVALLLVAVAGAVGCLLGSIAAYLIGYSGGRPFMLKYGRYLLISQHDADKADRFFQRWGSATTFFSRLLPVVRTYISLPAGIAKMPFTKFCIYTLLGSLPWCLLLAYVGTIIGGNLATLSPIFHGLDVFILIVLVVLIALYIWRHIRNDRNARAALTATESSSMQPPAQAQSGWGQQPYQPQWQQREAQPLQPPAAWGQPFEQQPAQPGAEQPRQSQFQSPPTAWGQRQQPPPPQADANDRTAWRS